MTELGEGVSTPPAIENEPDEPKEKDPLTIRIHLLYDGTKNNKKNIELREEFEVHGKKQESAAHKEHGKKDSSYDNGRTNIAIMEPHVVAGKDKGGYSIVVKIYVEGQGTFNEEGDSIVGYAMGAKGSGVYQRARKGINEAYRQLKNDFFPDYPSKKFFIRQVDIDVFGFSRGAATARHAIHVLTEEETVTIAPYHPSGYGTRTVVTNTPFHERLRLYGYSEIQKKNVNINFAGLYDTVVSVNASQLAPAWLANNFLDQRAVEKAKFALHLAAADEHREDFPLHRITSATSAGNGAEYFLPGAHSDIGGSYNKANEELLEQGKEVRDARINEIKCVGSHDECMEEMQNLIAEGRDVNSITIEKIKDRLLRKDVFRLYATREIEGLEYMRSSDENKIINRGLTKDLLVDMEKLIEDGWYKNEESKPPQIKVEVDLVATGLRMSVSPYGGLLGGPLPFSGVTRVRREGISSAYCYIPLKYMVEESRKMVVDIKRELDQRIKLILDKAPGLNEVDVALRAYMAQKGPTGSEPDDWTNIAKAEKHCPQIKELRNKHLHMSCSFGTRVMEPGFTPRFEDNIRRRFYYAG